MYLENLNLKKNEKNLWGNAIRICINGLKVEAETPHGCTAEHPVRGASGCFHFPLMQWNWAAGWSWSEKQGTRAANKNYRIYRLYTGCRLHYIRKSCHLFPKDLKYRCVCRSASMHVGPAQKRSGWEHTGLETASTSSGQASLSSLRVDRTPGLCLLPLQAPTSGSFSSPGLHSHFVSAERSSLTPSRNHPTLPLILYLCPFNLSRCMSVTFITSWDHLPFFLLLEAIWRTGRESQTQTQVVKCIAVTCWGCFKKENVMETELL